MKKTPKTFAMAAAFAAAMTMASCDGGSSSGGEPANDIVTSDSRTAVSSRDDSSEFDPSSELIQTEYDAPVDYDPSQGEPQTEYGAYIDYDPSEDDVRCVYGPPSDFEE